MTTGQLEQERDWARGRSRLGLWLGPGSAVAWPLLFVLSLVVVGAVYRVTGWRLPVDDERDRPMQLWLWWISLFGGVFVVLPMQLFSLTECLATVRMLRRPACPRAVQVLAAYWGLVALVLAWQGLRALA